MSVDVFGNLSFQKRFTLYGIIFLCCESYFLSAVFTYCGNGAIIKRIVCQTCQASKISESVLHAPVLKYIHFPLTRPVYSLATGGVFPFSLNQKLFLMKTYHMWNNVYAKLFLLLVFLRWNRPFGNNENRLVHLRFLQHLLCLLGMNNLHIIQ